MTISYEQRNHRRIRNCFDRVNIDRPVAITLQLTSTYPVVIDKTLSNFNFAYARKVFSSRNACFFMFGVCETKGHPHCHLVSEVPFQMTWEDFDRRVTKAIGSTVGLAKSYHKVKPVYDLPGWLGYMTKGEYSPENCKWLNQPQPQS